jgi:hypothetical protein
LLVAMIVVHWIYFIRDTRKQTGYFYNVVESHNEAARPLTYLVPYILALIGFDLNRFQDLIVLILLMMWLFVVYSKSGVLFSRVLFFNPVFYLRGYQMYEIAAQTPGFSERQSSNALLISKNDWADLPMKISVKELDAGVLLDISRT